MSGPHHEAVKATIEIDPGVREWYASCRCCLSDAHPEVVAILDAERDAAKAPRAEAGICEVEEAAQSAPIKEEVTAMAKILDPVCDMIVEVEEQRAHGLVSEHEGKTYAFCGPGCKRAFDKDPTRFTAKVASWEASPEREHGHAEHTGH